ncbi:MAG: DUF5611 family protein [Euryarchaeota archaeon]|nr:DUF5611 family protein [Euryarchaeota archaeon]
MRDYPFRRGVAPDLQRVAQALQECFGAAPGQEGGRLVVKHGSLERLEVWVENKRLCVESKSNPACPKEAMKETITRYNQFLERATGYNAKERAKKAKAEAGDE